MVNYQADPKLDDVFSALSDPTRRAIIEQLSLQEMTVSKLAEPFDMSLPAISKHLKVLETSGLVSRRKAGRFRYFSLNPHALRTATEWMNHWSRFWTSSFAELDRFLQEEDATDAAKQDPDNKST